MCLAVPGKLLSVEEQDPVFRWGKVDFGGVARSVSLAVVPEAVPGDYVLVHAGVALSRVDPEEAARVFRYLQEMEVLADGPVEAGS